MKTISRRGFLAAGGTAALGAFLAGCSKTVGTGVQPSPTSTVIEKELSVYNWDAYLSPKNVEAFQRTFGAAVTQDYFASNEDLQAKIKAGATGYDIGAPTLYMVKLMGYEDRTLFELDKVKLPNLGNIDPRYLNRPDDPGNRFSIPKDLGTTGIGYRADKIAEEITSWDDFFRLAPKYSGRLAVLDSAPEVIGSALKMLGYPYSSDDPAHLKEAERALLTLKPHLRAIDSANYDTMLQRGEVYAVLGWNGDVLVAADEAPKGADVRYVVPREGGEIWMDCWVILRSAPHPNAAHAFLNWLLEPVQQGEETTFTYYASPVDAAKGRVDAEVANDPAVYPPNEIADRLEFYEPTPAGVRLRSEIFTKFKAA